MQKERYKNKYIRQLLEERLKEKGFGVNIHCKESGVYLTIPPASTLDLYETKEEVDNKEDKMVDILVSGVSEIAKTLYLESSLDYVLHGDNIQIKIKVKNAR
jgi:hypothetical protein|tara:strand:+ start:1608 stop:1913 length:306 start_codon:yes stop_codon:yes gene_type:complete